MRSSYSRINGQNDGSIAAPELLANHCRMIRAATLCKAVLLALALTAAAPGSARANLQQRVEAKLREAGAGTRFGLVVVDESGRELVAIAPNDRFIPASNTKMFTTAAGMATLQALDAPDASGGAAVRLEGQGDALDVVLQGRGDARLSSASDCVIDCLAALADAVASRTRIVRNVIGDDSLYPDERWGQGMSWNNIQTDDGTAASALTLDDNTLPLRVIATKPGQAPQVEFPPYYDV